MANPRRNSQSNNSIENPFQSQSSSSWRSIHIHIHILQMLKKPQSLTILLLIFILLTWLSLSFHSSSAPPPPNDDDDDDDDVKTNLVRFKAAFPSTITKDKRGWLLNPVPVPFALDSSIKGGAVSCASVHVGQIRPGTMRGNHRHHNCNETFVIWGAKTLFRLENKEATDKGYAEVIVGENEVALFASPSGTAHALVNIDNLHTTYFIGCQDSAAKYNESDTDYNIWKDL